MSSSIATLHRIRCWAITRPTVPKAFCVVLLLTLSLQICHGAFAMAASGGTLSEQTTSVDAHDGTRPEHGDAHTALCCLGGSVEHQHEQSLDNAVLDNEPRRPPHDLIAPAAPWEPHATRSWNESLLWRFESQRPLPPVYLTTLRLRI
jgi:hypothetical protein